MEPEPLPLGPLAPARTAPLLLALHRPSAQTRTGKNPQHQCRALEPPRLCRVGRHRAGSDVKRRAPRRRHQEAASDT
jgi:hypothetical protein